MALVQKLDSNITEARISEETSFKEADPSAVWQVIEVNNYLDARGQFTKVARTPIASDRQRKKGVVTDLDAQFGANFDLTAYNAQDLLQGVMFADFEEKTNVGGAGELTAVNGSNQITAASGLAVFPVGALCVLRGGTQVAGNSNRLLRVTVSTGTALTFAQTLVAETLPAGAKLVMVGIRTAAGDLDINAAGSLPVLTSTTLDFTTVGGVGIQPGEPFFIGGDDALTFFSVNDENNALVRARSVSANSITIDKASKGALVTEANTLNTVEIYFGRVLKNQQIADIVRRTYQVERQLGASDDASPSQIQSEYFTGCVANEFTMNLQQADKITCDIKYIAADQETRTGATGLKAGTRPDIENADAQNTSSDLKLVSIAKIVSGDEAPTPLFAFIPNMTINFNNGVEPLKALTTLGAFDMSAADFVVNGSMSGYFNQIDSIGVIRANDSLTMHLFAVKGAQGWCLDLPLITISDGSIQVEKDKSIMVPLNFEAASGEEVDANLDHTAMWVFFDGLPSRAAEPAELQF